ncbi:hypothetical protein [Horticoccus sp. 23ND18S-11]|uniref:hypothetical protein n=1 Tax=Horticoccus sp. 23ND18S-11 TaxID=3391832 RepID=UPI0039C9E201
MSAPTLHIVHGQLSWSFRSSHVHANLTKLGGHLAPVAFRLDHRLVSPFAIAPWAEEKLAPDTPALLRALRGDFFCAPFGGNGTPWRGESHPPHGETANGGWRLKAFDRTIERLTFHASLKTTVRAGSVDKAITLVEGHTAVYQKHVLHQSGPMSVGHHALLKFPDVPGSGVVSTSRFVHAQVLPDLFERPENRGYQSLKPGAVIKSLDRVPLLNGESTDVSHFPARRGYDDLVLLSADPKLPFAWNAVTFPRERYVYFALRDPRALRHTILWISNGGRHYAPWNGRHTSVMGIEDTTSCFHYGLAESVKPNALSRLGLPTVLKLSAKKPTTIAYIMGVAAIPAGFDRVKSIHAANGGIELIAANGKRAHAPLDLGFLRE